MTVQRLRHNIEHGKFKDLEELQYHQLKRVREEWPKTN